jgi:hypothetical protein
MMPKGGIWISWGRLTLFGGTYAHDFGQPAGLGEGVEHDGNEEGHGQRQEGAWPPSNRAQNTPVGERLRPLLIITGERTFPARMLTTVTPEFTISCCPI